MSFFLEKPNSDRLAKTLTKSHSVFHSLQFIQSNTTIFSVMTCIELLYRQEAINKENVYQHLLA